MDDERIGRLLSAHSTEQTLGGGLLSRFDLKKGWAAPTAAIPPPQLPPPNPTTLTLSLARPGLCFPIQSLARRGQRVVGGRPDGARISVQNSSRRTGKSDSLARAAARKIRSSLANRADSNPPVSSRAVNSASRC